MSGGWWKQPCSHHSSIQMLLLTRIHFLRPSLNYNPLPYDKECTPDITAPVAWPKCRNQIHPRAVRALTPKACSRKSPEPKKKGNCRKLRNCYHRQNTGINKGRRCEQWPSKTCPTPSDNLLSSSMYSVGNDHTYHAA